MTLARGPGQFRSATDAWPVPLVVRLVRMVYIPFGVRVPISRSTLAVRDHGDCQVAGCARHGTTIDHVVARSRGGRHAWDNVALMCWHHNRAKADRSLAEMGWTLKGTPRAPSGRWLVLVAARAKPRTEWLPYLEPDVVESLELVGV